MKTYRRFIRVGDRLLASPQFKRKVDAEEWYHQMRRKKQFLRDGIEIDADPDDSITFMQYAAEWYKRRQVDYPMATVKADEQRLRDYILPFLSELPISTITGPHIRNVLVKITEKGFRDEGVSISSSTRDRVKALMSVIFTDALNEDPPLVKYNPVKGIEIKEKRKGKPQPRHLAGKDECLRFIKAAQEIGPRELAVVSLFLMSGMRKQEVIALKWAGVDFKKRMITVSEKYEQASNSIIAGTKAGEKSIRHIPVPLSLIEVLRAFRGQSGFGEPTDFVIPRHDGRFLNARNVSSMIESVREKAGLDISAHGLRHTFGREFALNTGNIKALQSILGHSSSITTDIYSNLAGDRVKGFGESVSFEIGVKGSTK